MSFACLFMKRVPAWKDTPSFCHFASIWQKSRKRRPSRFADVGESAVTEPPRTPTPSNGDPATASPELKCRIPMTNDSSSSSLSTLSHSESGRAYKDQQCDIKICQEVDELTAEVPYEKFMSLACGKSTRSLTPEQLTQVGDFSGLTSESRKWEWQMYPIFVSRSDIRTWSKSFSDEVDAV